MDSQFWSSGETETQSWFSGETKSWFSQNKWNPTTSVLENHNLRQNLDWLYEQKTTIQNQKSTVPPYCLEIMILNLLITFTIVWNKPGHGWYFEMKKNIPSYLLGVIFINTEFLKIPLFQAIYTADYKIIIY